jgi:hypothetical protein
MGPARPFPVMHHAISMVVSTRRRHIRERPAKVDRRRVPVRIPRHHSGHGSALLALLLVVIVAIAIGVMIGRRIRPRPNVHRVV